MAGSYMMYTVIKWDEVGYTVNTMLLGEYEHTLDDKRRVSLPSQFRKEIGKTVVLTRGLDHCIFGYSLSHWERIAEDLSNLPLGRADSRAFNRFMLSGAVKVDIDSAGRILIPEFLKEFAGLDDKVIMAGVYSRIEIWQIDRWQSYKQGVEKEADKLAEKLGEVGMI